MFTDRYTLPILVTVVICTLPHFVNVSLWVVVTCLLMWIYTIAASKYSWRLPGKLTTSALAAIFFIAAMTTHDGFTIEAFVALLALMVSMKLLEVRTERDRITTVILCYFLIVAGLFFGDSIGATLYILFSILCTTAVLIHVNQPERGGIYPLKLSGILMAQALPVALILFLFFPRIQGGLWGRAPVSSARTGFSDTMSFGNIAELASNSDVAFRVEFDKTIPPRNKLYWRGIVLWEFDGKTWRRGVKRGRNPAYIQKASDRVDYTVILEPHNEHWLLTLDLPLRISFRRAWLNSDHTCYRWWPITQRISYKGISDIVANAPLDEQSMKEALKLPASGNPRARALAKSLAAKAETSAGYVEHVLSYFREQPYFYTLTPPPLIPGANQEDVETQKNLVDRFLFQSRKGFCEHFAGSFAFLMRAAGVPARVVLGYQGGELNRYGGYLVVRQSDAHAWCEVWLPEKGWVRIDPTGVVAPARLTGDTADALTENETAGLLFFMRHGHFGQWFGATINAWDYLNSKWNRWVMDYSPYEDFDFFIRMGFDIESRKGWGQALLITLAAAIAILSIVITFLLFRRHKYERDEIAEAWIVFCRKLSGIGLPRRQEQGPVDYMEYILNQRPELADRVREIVTAYIKLRYRGIQSAEETLSLKLMTRQFSPKGRVH